MHLCTGAAGSFCAPSQLVSAVYAQRPESVVLGQGTARISLPSLPLPPQRGSQRGSFLGPAGLIMAPSTTTTRVLSTSLAQSSQHSEALAPRQDGLPAGMQLQGRPLPDGLSWSAELPVR